MGCTCPMFCVLVNYYDEKLFAFQRVVLIGEVGNKKWTLFSTASIA
jgi:hypothetical protein